MTATANRVFLSHASADDALVRTLQQRLQDLGQGVWIDSRELRGGDLLWPAIRQAIEDADAYAILVSPAALQSEWVHRELRHAIEVRNRRARSGAAGACCCAQGKGVSDSDNLYQDKILAAAHPAGVEISVWAIHGRRARLSGTEMGTASARR